MGLSDNKSPQVTKILLSIQANLDTAVFWMASIFPKIANSSSLYSKPLGTIPSASPTTCTAVTLMFQFVCVCMCVCVFNSLARFKYLSTFSLSSFFSPCSPPKWKNLMNGKLFWLVNKNYVWPSGLLVEIRGTFASQNTREFSNCYIPQSRFQVLGDCSKSFNYSGYHWHLYVPQLFQLSSKVQVFSSFCFSSFSHYSVVEHQD